MTVRLYLQPTNSQMFKVQARSTKAKVMEVVAFTRSAQVKTDAMTTNEQVSHFYQVGAGPLQ